MQCMSFFYLAEYALEITPNQQRGGGNRVTKILTFRKFLVNAQPHFVYKYLVYTKSLCYNENGNI
jgi:hypothetical protein